nr:MAG TPA: hypothetical protein [Bacteriophage sp.]
MSPAPLAEQRRGLLLAQATGSRPCASSVCLFFVFSNYQL